MRIRIKWRASTYLAVLLGALMALLRNNEPAAGASAETFRDSFTEMWAHWQGKLPFAGNIYHWRYEKSRLAC